MIATRPGQLPVRARLPGRLAAGLPALVAPGPRRRRHVHVLDDGASRRRLRGQGRDRRELGRRTTARAACRAAANIPFTVAVAGSTVALQLERRDPRPHDHRHGPRRRIRTPTTSSGTASGTTRAPPSTARPAARSPAGTAVKLRLRTFHDDVTNVKLRLYDVNASAQSLLPMTLAASGVSLLRPGARVGDVRLLGGDAAETARRTTSGTGSSSPTAPTPTTTRTTPPPSTAARGR